MRSPLRHALQARHACIRCPSFRPTPQRGPRLVEIIANLRDCITEAKLNGWSSEVAGLDVSLQSATIRLTGLDRMRDRQPSGPVNVGIPSSPPPGDRSHPTRPASTPIWTR